MTTWSWMMMSSSTGTKIEAVGKPAIPRLMTVEEDGAPPSSDKAVAKG